MTRSTALFIALIGILTVAVAAPFAMVAWNDYKFRQGVDLCVTDLSARDPAADARLALRNGDDRFFFSHKQWIAYRLIADGVDVRVSGSLRRAPHCDASGALVRAEDWKEIPFEKLRFDPGSHRPTKCAKASDQYIWRFNAEMARLSLRSVQKYCRQE